MQACTSLALEMGEAVKLPALVKHTSALKSMLDPMRRVQNLTLSNAVNVSNACNMDTNTTDTAVPQKTCRPALHQVQFSSYRRTVSPCKNNCRIGRR